MMTAKLRGMKTPERLNFITIKRVIYEPLKLWVGAVKKAPQRKRLQITAKEVTAVFFCGIINLK